MRPANEPLGARGTVGLLDAIPFRAEIRWRGRSQGSWEKET